MSYLLLSRVKAKPNEFTGSASPEQVTNDDTRSSGSFDSISTETWRARPPGVNIQTLPSITPGKTGKLKEENATKEPLRFLGRVAAMSRSTNTSDLDWAVVHLEGADIFSGIKLATKFRSFQNVVYALRGTKAVQVFTESDAATDGKITGTPTFMQVPHSIAFQEMWTVQLDGPLRE